LEITYSLVPNSCIWAGASSLKGSIEARICAHYLDVRTEQSRLIISLTQSYNERVKVDFRNMMSLQGLECGVCFLRFDNEGRRPIDLGCGHCFCQECTTKQPDSFRRCPECRVASVHPHPCFTLLRILAVVERPLEAQKVACKAEIGNALVAEKALQSKVWDTGRTHPDILITNNQKTVKRELNTTRFAVATINCPLTGSDLLVAANINKYGDNSYSKFS
jgi:hypothetical protein